MKMLFTAIVCLLLCGCGTQPKKPITVEVPVVIPCLKEIPKRPEMKFDSLPPPKNEAEAAEQIRVLWKDREAANQYGIEWEAAASGCLSVNF